jgi:hypothetical protein
MSWLAIFGVCTLFLLINSATIWYGVRAGFFPNAQPMRWGTLLLEQLTIWYPVALLAPACLWLAARFRLERERWAPTLAIHLGVNLAFHVCLVLISLPLSHLIWREPIFSFRFLQNLHQRLIGRIPIDVIIYWTIVGAGYAFEYYRRFREQQFQAASLELRATQLETQLAQAQLQALKMQLHPHFLFNTLHAISALIDDDVKGARRMIARLSELLRLTLDNAGQQEVSLRQELDALERYLEIEQIRFQDRLTVRLAVAPETLADKFDVAGANPLAAQDAIAERVTRALALKLSGEGQKLLSKRLTTNPEAYQAYLNGREAWNRRATPAIEGAIEYYEQAICRDPEYAQAHAALANAYAILGFRYDTQESKQIEAFPKAKAAAARPAIE